jgi:hypothetical protein
MNLRYRPTQTLFLAAAFAAVTVSCRDDRALTTPRHLVPGQPNAEINDGAHGGGNPDVFYLLPMGFPNNAPTFGARPFQPNLPVTFKIRNLATGDVITSGQAGLSTVQMSSLLQDYHALWNTHSPIDVPTGTYRVETWIGTKQVAFADVVLFKTLKQFLNIDTQQFVPLPDDWTLLIRVRVQEGWNCQNKSSCITQIVPNDLTTPVIVKTNDGLNAAKFSGHWHDGSFPVVVSIEDISAAVNAPGGGGCTLGIKGLVITNNHCVRFTADPDVVFTNTVLVNTCIPRPGDDRQLLFKYDRDEQPIFLRNEVPPITCPPGFASTEQSKNPLVRLASNALSKLTGLFMPSIAYAIDAGVGAGIDAGGGFSVFALGFPASLNILAGDGQTAAAGSAVPIAPQVRLVAAHVHEQPSGDNPHPEGVAGAQVTCSASAGGSVGGSQSALATESAGGVYTCPAWVLASGPNTLTVSAAGYNSPVQIEDLTGEGGEPSTLSTTAVFRATGTAGQFIDFESGLDCSGDCSLNDQFQGVLFQYSYFNGEGTSTTSPRVVVVGNNHQATAPIVAAGAGPTPGTFLMQFSPGRTDVSFDVIGTPSQATPTVRVTVPGFDDSDAPPPTVTDNAPGVRIWHYHIANTAGVTGISIDMTQNIYSVDNIALVPGPFSP